MKKNANGLYEVKQGKLTVYFKTKKSALEWLELNPPKIKKSADKKQVLADAIFNIIEFSSNSKLSNDRSFATVSASHETCPKTCVFIKSGCYGENYGINFHFNAIGKTKGVNLVELALKLNSLRLGQKIRFFDVGDVPADENGVMDSNVLQTLNNAVISRKLRAIQFTHNKLNYANIEQVKLLNYVVNFSVESFKDAALAIKNGVNAVITLPSFTKPVKSRIVDGLKIVTCPAQYSDLKLAKKDITCADCMLCNKNRVNDKVVIAFYAHGTQKKKIDNAILKNSI
jgi:hypothetical protein